VDSAEAEFERELAAVDRDLSLFAQYFYAYQATHYLASKDSALLATMNWQPLYWNTSLGALQEASFSTLGRIFDQDSRSHSVHRLFMLAQQSKAIFGLDALRERKIEGSDTAHEWIDEYMAGCYTPTAADWARLTRHLNKCSEVFVAKYRPLRHKVYAHRDRLEKAELEGLFSATSYRELEKLLASICALYDALWNLYHNGRKPVLRLRRYSLIEMIERPGVTEPCRLVGEMAALETKSVLAEYTLGRTAGPSNKRIERTPQG
jgi:hypothetical protein